MKKFILIFRESISILGIGFAICLTMLVLTATFAPFLRAWNAAQAAFFALLGTLSPHRRTQRASLIFSIFLTLLTCYVLRSEILRDNS